MFCEKTILIWYDDIICKVSFVMMVSFVRRLEMYSRVIFSRSSFLKVVVTINFPLLGPKRLYVSRLPTSSGGVAYHQTTLAVIRVHRTA